MEIVNQIVMKKISEVKPYVRNPRKNDKTVNLLVEIIPKVGFNVPLVVDKNGVIVKGHARYAAAIRLGMEQVPCVVTDADEETIKLDRLADNRISEFSEWVDEELLHEIDMLDLEFGLDLEALGFPLPENVFELESVFEEGVPSQLKPGDGSETWQKIEQRDHPERAAKEGAQSAAITTQAQVDRANVSALRVAEKPPKYAKVVCEHCGHVMFIKEGDAVFVAEQA